jgi:hypothetical protein
MEQSDWKLKEVNLFPPLRNWLKNNGCKVFTEIYGCDVVSYKDGEFVGYELKMACNDKVIRQAYCHIVSFGKCFAVVPVNPRKESIEKCKKFGVGIIKINNNEIIEILPAKKLDWEPNVIKRKVDITKWHEGEEAGRPNMKGEGPGQTCLISIKEYLKTHPDADWKEIYKNVSNHYCNFRSLQNSMYIHQGFSLQEYQTALEKPSANILF